MLRNCSLLGVFVKHVRSLQSNISCRKLSGLLVGEYTCLHVDKILSIIGFLTLAKTEQRSRKWLTDSSSRPHKRHVGLT